MKQVLRKFFHILYLSFASLIIGLAVMVSVATMFTPFIGHFRESLERLASAQLNRPIVFDDIHIHWQHFAPEIDFSNVRIKNESKNKHKSQTILSVKSLRLSLNLIESLSKQQLIAEQLSLSGVDLDLSETRQHAWKLNDLLNQQHPQLPILAMMQWMFGHGKIILNDVDVKWHALGEQAYGVNDLNIVVTNSGTQHHIVANAKALTSSAKMQLIADLNADVNDLAQTKGKVYLSLQDFLIPSPINSLINTKVWLQVRHGKIHHVQAALTLKKEHNLLSANIAAEHMNDHWQVSADHIGMRSKEYAHSGGKLLFKYFPKTQHYAFMIDYFPLNLLTVYGHDFLNEAYKTLHPSGVVKHFRLSKKKGFAVSADFESLAWNAFNQWPGVSGLNGHMLYENQKGTLRLHSPVVSMSANNIFTHVVVIDDLFSAIDFHKTNNTSYINGNVEIAKQITRFKLTLPSDINNSDLSLHSQFKFHSLASVLNNLPSKVMNADLLQWLQHAFVDQHGGQGELQFKGKLFSPFQHGLLQAKAKLNPLTLQYLRSWPTLQAKSLNLTLKNRELHVAFDNAVINKQVINVAFADVRNIGLKNCALMINGKVQTNVSQVLKFMQQSPLRGKRLQEISALHPSGGVDLELHLNLPLFSEHFVTQYQIFADLLGGVLPQYQVSKVHGKIEVNNKGVFANEVAGKWFGQSVLGTINSDAKNIMLRGQLNVDSDALLKSLGLSKLSIVHGGTIVKSSVKLDKSGELESIHMQSNLQGLGVDIPGVFSKTASSSLSGELEFKPHHISLKFPDIQTTLEVNEKNKHWLLDIDSKNIVGKVEFSDANNVIANFDRLILSKIKSSQDEQIKLSPKQLPNLNLHADYFQYADKKLGQVDMNMVKHDEGMLIDKLNIVGAHYVLKTHGSWQETSSSNKTILEGQMLSDDFSQTLNAWRLPNVIDSQYAKLSFKLHWLGTPIEFAMPKINGDLIGNFRDGHVSHLSKKLESKVGLGKFINILSLKSLAKRLSLDFSDIKKEGLPFDDLHADIEFKRGIADAKKVVLDGTVASLTLAGYVDLEQQLLHLVLQVTPHLTGSLPVVATIAAGPVAGVITWVADKLFQPEMKKLSSNRYIIDGPWQHPIIQTVH